MKTTRIFEFPNNGHSVRKLSQSLMDLGSTKVSLSIELDDQYGQKQYDVSFKESSYGVPANALAKKIITIGTRFTLDLKNETLKFYTDFDDIISNPETYLTES